MDGKSQHAALRDNRDFRRLWIGQALSMLGSQISCSWSSPSRLAPATSYFGAAETAATQRIVPNDQLVEAVNLNESREYPAYVAGPAIGGALYSVERSLAFLADTVSYAVSVVFTLLISTDLGPDPAVAEARPHLRREIVEGLRFVSRSPFVRVTTMISAASNFVSSRGSRLEPSGSARCGRFPGRPWEP
jgi:hypothetical protein